MRCPEPIIWFVVGVPVFLWTVIDSARGVRTVGLAEPHEVVDAIEVYARINDAELAQILAEMEPVCL